MPSTRDRQAASARSGSSRRRFLAAATVAFAGCTSAPATETTANDGTGGETTTTPSTTSGRTTTDGTSDEPTDDGEREPPTGDMVAWALDVGRSVSTAPVLDAQHGTLYVAAGAFERGDQPTANYGDFAARDVVAASVDGNERWRYEATADVVDLLPVAGSSNDDGTGGTGDGGVYAAVGWPTWPEGTAFRVEKLAGGERAWQAGGDMKAISLLGTTADGSVVGGTHDDALDTAGETLFAYAPDGTEAFSVESGDVFSGTILDDRIYVSLGGRLARCVDATTGATQWEHAGEIVGNRDDAAVSPDLVLVGADEGDENGNYPVSALDPVDGSERWQYVTDPADGSNFVATNAIVADGLVHVAEYSGLVFALDAETGDERWRADLGGDTAGGPVRVADTVVYSTVGGRIRAFALEDGNERWQRTVRGRPSALYAHGAGLTVDHSSDERTRIRRYDRGGNERWRFEHDAESTRLAVDDTAAYLGTADGYLAALSS